MRIISFDVGIKNLAYCILQVENDTFTIVDWNVINLLDTGGDSKPSLKPCTYLLKKKNTESCGKPAIYTAATPSQECFCARHAKMQTQYVMPTLDIAPSTIKKHKVDGLKAFVKKHGILQEVDSLNKSQILEKALQFFESRRLVLIPKPKIKNSNQTDLVQIGKQLKIALNQIAAIKEVTHVLIENQISTIASRMKTIQGMVAQYFIMVLENPQIEFISSSNKLKNFVKEDEPVENVFYPTPLTVEDSDEEDASATNSNTLDKKKYKQHKSDGVKYCLDILKKAAMTEWAARMEIHKKKDDLADSFLQGYWYIQKHCGK
jgi:Mitochondrial resolvase Ydc2 / RNA splicing MRS1